MRRLLSTALLLLSASRATAQSPVGSQQTGPTLPQALRLSAAGSTDSAVTMLEAIVTARRSGTPRALQELIGIYARTARPDLAYRAFERARFAGTDFTSIAARPDIGALRTDTRFAALFPATMSFDRPFVEPVRIIHEWRGDSIGDEFGWIARGIGDVDGDRVTDVVVSATTNPPYGSTQGKLSVYSGKSGRLLWTRRGERGWTLGTSVESAGDVNGDGVNDVIAGAPNARVALVLSGRDGRELHRFTGDSIETNFGGAVATAGDVDRDGYADVIVGASGTSVAGSGAGRVIVFSGKTGARLHVRDGERAGDAFGSSVAGDANGLLVVGAPGGGPTRRGQVYTYRTTGSAMTPAFVGNADSTGAALGAMFVAIAGDVDGDRVADVYASDFSNSARGPGTGRVYVYSGATGKPVLVLTGDSAGETLGTSASKAGDVNGDGRADLVVGSWQHGSAAWSGGRVTVYSGRDGAVLQRFTGRIPGETLGFDAVGIGDVDGDRREDFLITSAYSMVNGLRSGRVYIVAGTGAKSTR